VLLFSLVSGLETVNRWQVIGMAVALAGAILVITKGQTSDTHGVAIGDLLVFCAMLAWAGYTMVQNRVSAGIGFLARIGMFAAAGALFSLPLALHEMWVNPSAVFSIKAAEVYLFAGLVPGLFAYGAYSYLGSAFGAFSTSLSLYLGPVVGAVLSIIFLGEAPTMIHFIGGALSLGGMWLSLQAKPSAAR
jgi:drug/metabolite transporter (DMT)-like permease